MTDQNKSQFCHFLVEGNIICDTKATTVQEVVAELAQRVSQNVSGMDEQEIEKTVMLREVVMPTVIASGLAVPHARMTEAKDLIVAMALSKTGIDFGVAGMPPVKVVVLLLTPEDDPGIHLQVLAALARDFQNTEAVQEVSKLSNPADVIRYFGGSNSAIPKFLRACNVMNPEPITLMEHNTLREAIEVFATKNVDTIPVIDNTNELRGIISLSDLLKFSLPEHLLWMDDLSTISRFQPFAEMLQTANESKVADIMRDDYVTVDPELPAIQLAKLFIMNNLRKLLVVSSDNHLVGEVDIKDFCADLFWK